MNAERLRRIIEFSNSHCEEMRYYVKNFCSIAGIDNGSELLNILRNANLTLEKKGYFLFEMPFDDEEIGALCYRNNGFGYVVVNTSLPKANMNFAIAHEIYHVFYGKDESVTKVEFAGNLYYEHEEEYEANLFAGMLLMPEESFRRMYTEFKNYSENRLIDTIVRLMAYYQVPYMAVLIRCLELGLLAKNDVDYELLNVETDNIKQKLSEFWLDESILEATNKDDYKNIRIHVENIGRKYIEEEYINNRTLEKVLLKMDELDSKIKKGK